MTTLTSKGQVTIPKALRDRLGLKAGSAVEFMLDSDGRVIVKAARAKPGKKSPFARLRGSLHGQLTTDEIMALTRSESGE